MPREMLKVGDVVHLISGDPEMTVTRTPSGRANGYPTRDDGEYIRCAWFDYNNCSQIQVFPPAALKRVPK